MYTQYIEAEALLKPVKHHHLPFFGNDLTIGSKLVTRAQYTYALKRAKRLKPAMGREKAGDKMS